MKTIQITIILKKSYQIKTLSKAFKRPIQRSYFLET